MKKLIIGIAVLVIIILASAYYFTRPTAQGALITLSPNVALHSDANFTLAPSKPVTTKRENATDITYTYDVSDAQKALGTLQIVVREIDNGDQFVFQQFTSKVDEPLALPIKLVVNKAKSMDYFSFEEPIEQEHDRVFGIDYTSNIKGIFTFNKRYDILLSQNYISKQLTETYDDGSESRLRELIREDKTYSKTHDNQVATFTLPLHTTAKNDISESWMLVSKDKLFDNEDERNYYKNFTNDKFIMSNKWLVADGTYTKLPWSVEPATKVGYGRNLVALQANKIAKLNDKVPQRFYYNMIVNSLNDLLLFKGDAAIWQTEYTSTWLKKDYGIQAPYTDTRHNENIALFLSQAGKLLNNKDVASSDLIYANFLADQERIDNILRTDNGYYILDYYSKHQTKKTHVSLNHALGEMNFLFKTYKKTNNKDYKNTALAIKQAFEDTGLDWINQTNGDLWYQIDGSGKLSGKDYDVLTLEDLIASLTLYEELDIPYDLSFYYTLISSKLVYLMSNDVPMPIKLYENLTTLGFASIIEGYDHVVDYNK